MSGRGGRGGGRGGRGGRGGPGDGLNLAGMTYADISASGSAQQEALYPDYPHPFPSLPAPSASEQAALATQIRFSWNMSLRPSYLKQATKTDDIERYSDRYLPPASRSSQLEKSDFPPKDCFPTELYDGYFNPGKRAKSKTGAKLPLKKKLKLSEIAAGAVDGEEEEENEAGAGSEVDDEDYDVDDGEDDYADQYFDNGEDDDGDEGGGGGDDDGGTFD